MAQFDIYWIIDRGLAVDCQSDLIDEFSTRFMVPLQPHTAGASLTKRLHPRITVRGADYILLAQLGTAVRKRDLAELVGSAVEHEYEIKAALDMLISGF